MVTRPTLAAALLVPNLIAIEATNPLNCYVVGDVLPAHMVAVVPTLLQLQAAYDAAEPLIADLMTQAAGAKTTNTNFIAIATPTLVQVAAHAKALSQQNNKIMDTILRIITWKRPSNGG